MGVAQNSLMSIIGAVGTVGVASRMISNEANQQINLGMQAQKDVIQAQKEMPQLAKDIESAGKQLENVEAETKALGELNITSEEDMVAYKELAQGVANQQQKAKLALTTAQNEIISKQDIKRRAKIRMDAARKWGGLM